MRLSLILFCLQLWGNVRVSLSQNVTCPNVPVVPHAEVSENTRKAEYTEGNVIHFTCETGYVSGPTIRYVCTAGRWLSLREGQCYLKPCELPEDTPNGYFEIIQGEDFVFGTTIKYYCNEGYQMVSKDDTRTCLLTKWTNHVPICDPLRCEAPTADGGLIIKGLPENDEPILPDRFLSLSCEPGKQLNGSSRLICRTDGQWDNPIPSCEEITCEAGVTHRLLSVFGLPSANGKMNIGHKLQFECINQSELEGQQEIRCLETGQWSAPFPTCSEQCRVTDLPSTVVIAGHRSHQHAHTLRRKGEKLRFICYNFRYVIHGSQEVECLADGQWSHPFPTCRPPADCEKPPALLNGDTVESTRFRYTHGERVEYACTTLHEMEGDPFRTCKNGEWTGDERRCLKPCTVDTDAMQIHHIAFKHRGDPKLYSRHNDQIEFKCERGRRHDRVLSMRQTCIDGVMHLPNCN